jgi:proteic killer suppression protein
MSLHEGTIYGYGGGGLFFDLAQIGRKKALDKWRLSLYIVDMIRSFRHAGLKRFYERGDRRRFLAEHVSKIARVLAQLDVATDASDMDLPGFHLHRLTGNLAGFWSVTVRANWRIIFRFDDHSDRC